MKMGRSGDRTSVKARFSAPVQTDPGAHSPFCVIGTRSLSQAESGGSVVLITHSHLAPRLKKE